MHILGQLLGAVVMVALVLGILAVASRRHRRRAAKAAARRVSGTAPAAGAPAPDLKGLAAARLTFVLGPPAAPDQRERFDAFQKSCEKNLAAAMGSHEWAAEEKRAADFLFAASAGAARQPEHGLSAIANEPIYLTRYTHRFRQSRDLWCSAVTLQAVAPRSDRRADGPLGSSAVCRTLASVLGASFTRRWVEWEFAAAGAAAGAPAEHGVLDVGEEPG